MGQSGIKISWKQQMSFEAEVHGHKIMLDADESVGGQNLGPRPKAFVMVALAGCTGMDVVSMLTKMRVPFTNFDVRVESELSDEHPKRYTKMHVVYEFWGKDLPMDKLQKAVSLSEERYCGVSATLQGNVVLSSEIVIHEE